MHMLNALSLYPRAGIVGIYSGQLVAAGSSQSSGNYSWILPSIDVHLRINGFARSKLTHHITFLLDVIFKEFIP